MSASVRGIGVAVSARTCGSPSAALGLERRALPDAEPVLLVDDRQRQPREVDRLADDGVGADHDLRLSGRDRVVDLALRPRAERAGQELRTGAEPLEERRKPDVMLAREDLGRRHQCRLPAGPHGGGQRDGGDGRLAAPDVALEQAAHRRVAADVGEDRIHRRCLVAGERERHGADDLVAHGFGDPDPRRPGPGACGARLGKRELQRQQLVEGQPVERIGHVGPPPRGSARSGAPRPTAAAPRDRPAASGSSTAGSATSRMRASSSRSRFCVTPAARW